MSILSKPYFHDEAAAVKHLESIVWARGVVCPHCGTIDGSGELKGKTARAGLRKCYSCRKQFTVKVGTVFESSHIPLHKWLQAAYLMSSSKKGISSHQLHRTLEITYKSAWFMTHRLREAMRVLNVEPMGGEGATVEANAFLPFEIIVDDIEIFSADSDLPDFDDLRGKAPNIMSGKTSEEFIAELRNDWH